MSKLRYIEKLKKSMTLEQKQRILKVLHSIKEGTGNVGGETDIINADNLVAEDEFTASTPTERNVIAKTFNVNNDFDRYVNIHRGFQMTPKEIQSIQGYRQKPTQQDRFFVKYESSDEFGNNDTTIVKKLKDGNQYCWIAFSKNDSAEEPEETGAPENKPEEPPVKEGFGEVTSSNPIRITKTVTFMDDTQGADILADFLEKLDI